MKRFTIRKNNEIINTNTLLLTFNSVVTPKTLKIFYQIIKVELYVPNPLRCFNCQKYGHHESNCPADLSSVCEKCGKGNHDHLTSQCQNKAQCVNCVDRMKKGTDDPIQNHNKFGPLADDGAMETDEGTMRSGDRGSRPRSPVKAPK